MLAVVIQIDGYDPVANAAVTLRASSRDHPAVCHLDGQTWWPTIAKLPTLRYDLFDGAFGGEITAPSSTTTLAVEPWPDFGRYSLADARFRLWTGVVGAEWATYTLRFDGRIAEQPETKDGQAQVAFGVDDRWLDQALLPTYAGTTGIEGPASLKGQVKPLCLGAPRYVAGVLIDVVNSVFQVSFAAVKSITAAMDRLVRFGAPAGDYATYADLVAAAVPPGRWATCLASGLARFGAPPEGLISFLVEGDNGGPNGWARLPGQLIRRLALLSGAGDRLAGATPDALDAARPYQLSLYLDGQTTARQLIQQLAASVNAVAAVSWTGKLVILPVQLSAPTIMLAADGSALPPVASVGQVAISAPWSKLAIGAERAWAVHDLADIAFTAPLLELGPYNAATIYREGNIVSTDDGTRWLYVAAAAGAGNAPPSLPTTSNSWWRLLSKGGSADLNAVNKRIDDVDLKATDANSKAIAAAADAKRAIDAIDAIVADGILSRDEKPAIILEWSIIEGEQATLIARADQRGVSSGALTVARNALAQYLGSLSPAWNDTSQNTSVNRETFKQRFVDYYGARTALVAQLDAKAKDQEDKAFGAIDRIGSDGWLDRAEKTDAVLEWRALNERLTVAVNRYAALGSPANATTPKNDAGAAVQALGNYLGGLSQNGAYTAWNDNSADTPITRQTWNDRWADALKAVGSFEQALVGNVTSEIQQGITLLLDANKDGVWSIPEKIATIIPDDRKLEANYQILLAAANANAGDPIVATARDGATTARANWINYRDSVRPFWNDITQSSIINRQTANDRLVEYGAKLEALAEALRKYVDTRVSGALDRLTSISSDSVLDRSEKPQAVIEWQVMNIELNALNQRNADLGYPADIAAASTAANAKISPATSGSLGQYLGSLSPAWDNSQADTPINAGDWRTKWVDALAALATYRTAITGRKGDKGDKGDPAASAVTTSYANNSVFHGWRGAAARYTVPAGGTVNITLTLDLSLISGAATVVYAYIQVYSTGDSFIDNRGSNSTSVSSGEPGYVTVVGSFTNNTGTSQAFNFHGHTVFSNTGTQLRAGVSSQIKVE